MRVSLITWSANLVSKIHDVWIMKAISIFLSNIIIFKIMTTQTWQIWQVLSILWKKDIPVLWDNNSTNWLFRDAVTVRGANYFQFLWCGDWIMGWAQVCCMWHGDDIRTHTMNLTANFLWCKSNSETKTVM